MSDLMQAFTVVRVLIQVAFLLLERLAPLVNLLVLLLIGYRLWTAPFGRSPQDPEVDRG
jgi:hypothetical protein